MQLCIGTQLYKRVSMILSIKTNAIIFYNITIRGKKNHIIDTIYHDIISEDTRTKRLFFIIILL